MLIKHLRPTLRALKSFNVKVRLSTAAEAKNMGVAAREVVKSLQSFAPLTLAESWDNVGLLIDPMSDNHIKKILLTNDLSEDVVDEAIEIKADFIVSYHPIIFQGLKSVCASTWKERVIVKCIRNEISVFSPHTSWDCVEGGVNDWLASAFTFTTIAPIKTIPDDQTRGAGRLINLQSPITMQNVVDRVKRHVGIDHLRLALARHKSLDSPVTSVALCAGSGGSVLKGTEADLYLTGEMSHHEVLDASQRGIHVILCEHSNSERGFLKIFKDILQNRLLGDAVEVVVSATDRDPLATV